MLHINPALLHRWHMPWSCNNPINPLQSTILPYHTFAACCANCLQRHGCRMPVSLTNKHTSVGMGALYLGLAPNRHLLAWCIFVVTCGRSFGGQFLQWYHGSFAFTFSHAILLQVARVHFLINLYLINLYINQVQNKIYRFYIYIGGEISKDIFRI